MKPNYYESLWNTSNDLPKAMLEQLLQSVLPYVSQLTAFDIQFDQEKALIIAKDAVSIAHLAVTLPVSEDFNQLINFENDFYKTSSSLTELRNTILSELLYNPEGLCRSTLWNVDEVPPDNLLLRISQLNFSGVGIYG